MVKVGRYRLAIAAATMASVVVVLATPAWADVNFTSGRAFGESVNVTLAGINITSGPRPIVTLPATGGGPLNDNLADVNLPDALHATVLDVNTRGAIGASGFVESSADVATVQIGPADSPVVEASVVHSECRSDAVRSTGTASLASLIIGGMPVANLEPPANTVIPVPGVGEVRL